MAAPPPSGPIPPEVRAQAVEWLVALQADDADDGTRTRWRHWHDAHPDHAQAWARIEAFAGKLQGLPSAIAHATLNGERMQTPVPTRRKALKALGTLAGVGGAAWLAREQTPWREWSADHRTGVGERKMLALADGSTVQMNADSAVDIRYGPGERRIRLVRGEILVRTASDPLAAGGAGSRPFSVDTAEGNARALGTWYQVTQRDGRSEVAVFGGAVELRPAQGGAVLRLDAGKQAGFTRQAIGAARPVGDDATAWIDGMLVAHDMPLADFLAALAPYRPGRLRCAPSAARITVSGTYPLADTDKVLDMLEATLPVAIRRTTRYWVTVELKKNPGS